MTMIPQTQANWMLENAYLNTKEYFHWSLVQALEQNPQLVRFIETFNSRSLLTTYAQEAQNSTHTWESIHEGIRHSVIFPICGIDADPLVLVSFTIDQIIDDHSVAVTIEDVFELDGAPNYFEKGLSYLTEGSCLPFLARSTDTEQETGIASLNGGYDISDKKALMFTALRKWIFSESARPQKLARVNFVA
jgi:hypothetical protein